VQTAEFDYSLPPELIAQRPAETRDASRLLVLHRQSGQLEHRQFADFPTYLRAGDVLVLNNSKVIPARLHGRNEASGGEFELLLLEENGRNDWWAMMRPAKRARLHSLITLMDATGRSTGFRAEVIETNAAGHRRLQFQNTEDISRNLETLGDIPLPPYIKRPLGRANSEDYERYQTVYAQRHGSVAAPTAGLHFTPALLEELRRLGVRVAFLTLHVGFGTFAPVKVNDLAEHRMHEERFTVDSETAALVNEARSQGRRVLAVGTTSLRALESATTSSGKLEPVSGGRTGLFIHPPHHFRCVDGLLTNFHLPCSTLLMLVSAFAAPGTMRGQELIRVAYAEAVQQRYRFFSYGDAMFIA
jgi:S-adenosylmethionine:tRNA ribosyltransferase-isomerase